MTAEELNKIMSLDGVFVEPTMVRAMAAEIGHLWAERDTCQVAGSSVSEADLADTMSLVCAMPADYAGKHKEVVVHLNRLARHVRLLERLLLDGDDLLAVRRTGYADGWRAGLEYAITTLKGWHGPLEMNTWMGIIGCLRQLAKEGPP